MSSLSPWERRRSQPAKPTSNYLEAAAHSIGAAMDDSRFRVVVNKSTVPVGSGNLVETLVREGIGEAASGDTGGDPLRRGQQSRVPARGLRRCRFALSRPHRGGRLRRPDARASCGNCIDPLVAQIFDAAARRAAPGRRQVECPLFTTSLTSAEMIKYAANAFLAMKIGFANEIANICERVGAEATEVMTGHRPRFAHRRASSCIPGIGWGGSCFGKDIQALLHTAREYGYTGSCSQASLDVNHDAAADGDPEAAGEAAHSQGPHHRPAGAGLQARDGRSARCAQPADRRAAVQMGARVKAYDPIAMPACREQHPELKIRYCESAEEVAAGADALVLVTEWGEFRELDLPQLARSMARPILWTAAISFRPRRRPPPASITRVWGAAPRPRLPRRSKASRAVRSFPKANTRAARPTRAGSLHW